MALPSLIVIGAGKSGTTSLHKYLDSHPEIFMCRPKEPRFFGYAGTEPGFAGPGDDRLVCLTDQGEYERLFDDAAPGQVLGDASTWYLTSPNAPQNIRRLTPDATMVAVLRNPVERCFSHWMHLMREGVEQVDDFVAACLKEPERIAANWSPHWHYVRQSRYHEGLSRYLEVFPRGQIRIFLYEDLVDDPIGVAREIYRMVGVDEAFEPDTTERLNVGGVPRSRILQRYLENSAWSSNDPLRWAKRLAPKSVKKSLKRAVTQANLSQDVELSLDDRRRIGDLLADDLDRLEDLIGRDLSAWRSVDDVVATRA
ncbi:MAG: sulfotransferase [Pseudomonadota bacterium]